MSRKEAELGHMLLLNVNRISYIGGGSIGAITCDLDRSMSLRV